ncbi:T9SS type A sorting domain-containing protein [Seonamhaeicola sp. NFXS20]|uniref:T9SS type A sorting domain-containing protein n=1 Tax=Seonamhaeicola sp. NFXS20 TaxID=2816959 RepID=UPI003B8E2336
MKQLTTIITLLLALNFSFGQTTLAEGDIAITGVNLDNNDQFSFVLLRDVTIGTEIHFTDEGWLDTGGFRGTGEGSLTWTATTGLSCGTVVLIERVGNNLYSVNIGSVATLENGFNLNNTADQVIAFQGSVTTPTFIYAVHLGNTNGWSDAIDTENSAIPAGLTEGVNALDLGSLENQVYNCAVQNGQAEILLALADTANWSGSSSARQILGGCTYTCNAPASCTTTVTYNGGWSGAPDLSTEVIIASNYDTASGSFSACSLTVNAGVTLTVSDNSFVEVENDVVVDGDLIVETQGNFVQNDDNGSFTLNTGGIARVKKTTPVKAEWYYYTYWSSPVVDETIENVFPDVPTGRRFYFDAANYLDADDDGVEDNGGAWAIASGTMTPGVGYAATEGTLFPGGAAGTASFEGEFNNGIIEVDVYNNPANGDSWNLIGNPYPSAIDFIAFQQANSSVIDGTAYFWSQASPPDAGNTGNEVLNFNTADYAVFTVGAGGGVKGGGSDTPDGYVASGQSFFVAGLTNDKATFTNAMRMADDSSNNLFFKRNTSKKSTAVKDNKFWIDLTSDNGVFKEILVAYVDGATNANDGMYYDAPKIAVSEAASLFSKIEGSNQAFAIQCKAASSLNEEETIALGFKTNIDVPTLYTLSLADIQGDFLSGSPVYLKDNLLNKVHDLSVSDYTFTSEVGEFNERFVIGFSNNTLSTDTALTNDSSLKIVALDNDYVQFSTSNDLQIKSVAIYDLLGRALYNFKGSSSSETYKLSNLKSAVFLAKVELSNGAVISKKAVKK